MGSQTVTVIGGGPAGMRAALSIADVGGHAVLIEKRDQLGGTPIAENYAGLTPFGEAAEPQLRAIADEVLAHPGIDVRFGAEVVGCAGQPGAFELTVRSDGATHVVETGAVVVATGFQHFDPGRETQFYGYYEYPDVITLPDLEGMLKEHRVVRPSTGEAPRSLCFIQCVGSRDRQIGNEYCSKVCCGVASKEAIEVRQLLPDCKVYIFYIDMRMYGYWESQIYWPAQEKHHVQYVKGMVTEVIAKGDQLLIRGEDTTMGRPMELPMDIVVLSVGMEPSVGTREIAATLGVRQNKYGFIDAVRSPLDPVATSRDGVFACGAALGPADLEDSVSSASNAAMRALAFVRSHVAAEAV
jgi:heterodisulfide reductase subunit A